MKYNSISMCILFITFNIFGAVEQIKTLFTGITKLQAPSKPVELSETII